MKKDASGKELAEIIAEARPGHPLRNWLAAIIPVLALTGAGFWYFQHAEKKETGPVYKTEQLTRGDLSLVVTASGNLAPTNQVTVGSELSGTVSEVYVDANDAVKKGQPIAQLDTSKLTQQTVRSQAVLLASKTRVRLASATVSESSASFRRLQELHRLSEGRTPSKADMETAIAAVERATAEFENANATVSQAEADLKFIERDLSNSVIRSPVDGIVLTRTIEVGQTVAASFTAPVLFLIAEDLRKMDLVVAVAEADIGHLANEQSATFKVDAWPTRTYTAVVKRVSFGSVLTNNVVTYNAELSVTNDDLSLRPGMTATTDISVAKNANALLVPNAALRFDPSVTEALGKQPETKGNTLMQSLSSSGGRRGWRDGTPTPVPLDRGEGSRVWTLKDGKPVEILVETGITDGRFTVVTGEGLAEGISVIVTAKPATSS